MESDREREIIRSIAFVDLAGFTSLSEAHGDLGAADTAQRLVTMTRDVLGDSAELVKSLGDAVMLVAVENAPLLGVVERLAARWRTGPEPLLLRGGIHCGPVVRVDNDYFGRAVNIAARVAGLAPGGQVWLTVGVAEHARTGHRMISSAGAVRLRGVPEPVEVFVWTLDGGSAGIDPVCKMRVGRPAGHLRWDDRVYLFCSLACVRRFAAKPTAYAGDATEWPANSGT